MSIQAKSRPFELWALDAAVHYEEVEKYSYILVLFLDVSTELNWAVIKNSSYWGLVVTQHGTVPTLSRIRNRLAGVSAPPELDLGGLSAALNVIGSSVRVPIDCILFLSDFLRLIGVSESIRQHPFIATYPNRKMIDDVPEMVPPYNNTEWWIELPVVRYEHQSQQLVLEKIPIIRSKDKNGNNLIANKSFFVHPESDKLFFDFQVKSKGNAGEERICHSCFRVEPNNTEIRVKVTVNYSDDRLAVDFPGSTFTPVDAYELQPLPNIRMQGNDLQIALLVECFGGKSKSNNNNRENIMQVTNEILDILVHEIPSCKCSLCFYSDVKHKEIRGPRITGDVLLTHHWSKPAELQAKANASEMVPTQDGRAALEEALNWASQLSWQSPEAYLIVLGSMEPHPGPHYYDHVACVNKKHDWHETLSKLSQSDISIIDIHFGHEQYPYVPGCPPLPRYWERQHAGRNKFLQFDNANTEVNNLVSEIIQRWRKKVRPLLSQKLELPLEEPWVGGDEQNE